MQFFQVVRYSLDFCDENIQIIKCEFFPNSEISLFPLNLFYLRLKIFQIEII